MDSRTVVAWVQLAIGAYYVQRTVGRFRAGRAVWKVTIFPGLLSSALGVEMLTSGWVREAAWVIAGVGAAFVIAQMFAARDRASLWMNVVFSGLALPIVLVELRFDDLSPWQWVLFAGVGVVLATLMVVTIVRLTRSYGRIALPSA